MKAAAAAKTDSGKMRICCHKCEQKLDVTMIPAFAKIPCPNCSTTLIVPKWFGQYLLEEKCGTGGLASVYRALDVTLDREIAVKISTLTEDQDELTEIFLHEGRITAKLNHTGIIPIYSCGQLDGKCFLVMQYMPGGSLKEKIDPEKPLKITQVLDWIIKVAGALKAALDEDVIHHDIKPDNILLDTDGSVKVGDFGLAYALNDAKSQDLLDELSSFCSPDYVSPEKLINGYEDHKGDIFSMGVTFYQLLTGHKPFKHPGEEEDIMAVRASAQVQTPNKIRPEISVKLSKFVMRMLDPCPGLRPEYNEIIGTLKDFREKYRKHEDKTLYRFVAKYL